MATEILREFPHKDKVGFLRGIQRDPALRGLPPVFRDAVVRWEARSIAGQGSVKAEKKPANGISAPTLEEQRRMWHHAGMPSSHQNRGK